MLDADIMEKPGLFLDVAWSIYTGVLNKENLQGNRGDMSTWHRAWASTVI